MVSAAHSIVWTFFWIAMIYITWKQFEDKRIPAMFIPILFILHHNYMQRRFVDRVLDDDSDEKEVLRILALGQAQSIAFSLYYFFLFHMR